MDLNKKIEEQRRMYLERIDEMHQEWLELREQIDKLETELTERNSEIQMLRAEIKRLKS